MKFKNHTFQYDFNIIQICKTALHLAVQINNTKIIKLLLERKDIEINIKDSNGEEPVYYAKNEEIKQLLHQ